MAIDNEAMNLSSDSECPDGTCPLKQPSAGGYKVSESDGECRVCGGGRKRKLAPGSSTVMQGRGGPRGPRDDIKSGPLKIGQPSSVPTSTVVPATQPGEPTSVVVPARNDAPQGLGMVPVKPQPQLAPTSVVVPAQASPRLATVLAAIGGGAINRGMIRRPGAGDTAQSGPIKTSQSNVSPTPSSEVAIRPATTLSVPGITAGRGNGPRINMPERKSVPVTPSPAPTSTVVTPKQQPEKEPLVLQPFVPLQSPPPDYCSDPRFASLFTEGCVRGPDGDFPRLSSACETRLRTLIERGVSAAEIRQDELCGPEFVRILGAGPTPTIGTPPKAGATATTDAKGMPIDVPGAVKIVAPGGAPAMVSGEKCLAAFLRLNPVVQQRIVGLFAQYPQARAVHSELARGVMDAPPTFVNWFRNAFSTTSPEASAFCAAVMSAMQGVVPAGAPFATAVKGGYNGLTTGFTKTTDAPLAVHTAGVDDTTVPNPFVSDRWTFVEPADCFRRATSAMTPAVLAEALSRSSLGRDPYIAAALPALRAGSAEVRAQIVDLVVNGIYSKVISAQTEHEFCVQAAAMGYDGGAAYLGLPNLMSPRHGAPGKAATHPLQSGTATFKAGGAPVGASVAVTPSAAQRDVSKDVGACLRKLAAMEPTLVGEALASVGALPSEPTVAWARGFLTNRAVLSNFRQATQVRDALIARLRAAAEKPSVAKFILDLCAVRSVYLGVPQFLEPGQTDTTRGGSFSESHAPSKAALQPFQSGTATFGVSGKDDGVRASGYPLNIAIPSHATIKLATRPAGDVPGAVPSGWEGVQSFTGSFGGNQGGAFGTGGQQGGLGEAVIPPTQTAAQGGLSTQQILGGIGQIGQAGLGFLNQFLDRDSRDHLAELQANASSANAQIAANAGIEIARIQAQAQENIARLGPSATQQQVSNALNSSIPSGGTSQGMSTEAKVGIGVAVAAVVGGGIYVATRKRR